MTDEEQDQSEEIQRSIDCMFADLDVDGDGKLVRSPALPWQLFSIWLLSKIYIYSLLKNTNYQP